MTTRSVISSPTPDSADASPAKAGKSSLDRLSPLPLYAQIKRRLLYEIHGWSQADRPFTPEHELAARFGVARATMRQAMSELVSEGYLVRRRGLGTFVMTEKVVERIDTPMNFIEQWASLGRKMTFEVLRAEKASCPPSWEACLGVKPGENIWHVVRLRRADRVPVSIDYRYINIRFAKTLKTRALEKNSILDLLDSGTQAAMGEFGIECREVDLADAEHLSLMPGDQVLTRHLTYWNAEREVLFAGVSHYRADQGRWSVRVPLEPRDPRNVKQSRTAGAGSNRAGTD
jgi:GntR family transcriptional regulator